MKIIVELEGAALTRIRTAINLRGFTEDNKRQKLITSTSISNSPLRVRTSSTDGSMNTISQCKSCGRKETLELNKPIKLC